MPNSIARVDLFRDAVPRAPRGTHHRSEETSVSGPFAPCDYAMKSTPLVTIGIPTFNRSAWLKESIESVLAQTFQEFRILVSDNASTDDTPDVVQLSATVESTTTVSSRESG